MLWLSMASRCRGSNVTVKPACTVDGERPGGSLTSTSERVGPYVIDAPLGGGTYGSVLRCQHPQSGQSVAVKVYRGP